MGGQQTARPEARRRWVARRERQLAELADRQHGVVSREQLLAAGLSVRTIERRVADGRLQRRHRGVFSLGPGQLAQQGTWMAAVLACGAGAALSHRSAAMLWGFLPHRSRPVDITAARGRRRQGIAVHQGGILDADRTIFDRIPVTTPARTFLDLAESVDWRSLKRAWEEAERLRLVAIPAVEQVCTRAHGRRGLKPLRRLLDDVRGPMTRSPLEDRIVELCQQYELPMPMTNVEVLGREVDAFWPDQKLMIEADSFEFHGHRAAFERDRARDAAMLVAGYRVVRLTHRRLQQEPAKVAAEIRLLLGSSQRAVS